MFLHDKTGEKTNRCTTDVIFAALKFSLNTQDQQSNFPNAAAFIYDCHTQNKSEEDAKITYLFTNDFADDASFFAANSHQILNDAITNAYEQALDTNGKIAADIACIIICLLYQGSRSQLRGNN